MAKVTSFSRGLWAVVHFLRLAGAEVVVGAVGEFVGIKTEVIYGNDVDGGLIRYVESPWDDTDIGLDVECLHTHSLGICALLKALCSVTRDADEGNFLFCKEVWSDRFLPHNIGLG